VLFALILIGVVATVIFLSARRRLSTWMLLAATGLLVAGGLAWAHEPSHRHAPVVPSVALAPLASESADALGVTVSQTSGSHGEATVAFVGSDRATPVDTGTGPYHPPALVLLALGGAAGLTGFLLRKRSPRSAA
jgi:hypothetical protein